jgi:hypothetical protein
MKLPEIADSKLRELAELEDKHGVAAGNAKFLHRFGLLFRRNSAASGGETSAGRIDSAGVSPRASRAPRVKTG